jgi:tryptophanyl-tRNA synthetase
MGLDPDRVVFYRQSDIPEIFELAWVLGCFTPKGWMNKAHAYKAAVAANEAAGGADVDAGINMGVYGYPILMAADILAFDIDLVPVGKDQQQHVEIARDVAQRLNHSCRAEVLRLPQAKIEESVAVVPGLDGRKMSKSYDNVVPLFEGGSAALKDAVARIVTDSKLPGEPKEPEGQALVTLFDAFATPEQRAAFRAALRAGLGWGEAKQQLVAQIEGQIGPMRARYEELMNHPEQLEAILQAGAARARAIAAPFLQRLRAAVGLRPYTSTATTTVAKAEKAAQPVFKQYREADGKFYFKLLSAGGELLLQSSGFDQGREAGQWVARLKREGLVADAPIQREADDSAIAAALATFQEDA